jgi:hypothetical protein
LDNQSRFVAILTIESGLAKKQQNPDSQVSLCFEVLCFYVYD